MFFFEAFLLEDFLKEILIEFNKKSLTILRIEFAEIYNLEMEWETSKTQKYYNEILEKTKKIPNLIFDTFYAFKSI